MKEIKIGLGTKSFGGTCSDALSCLCLTVSLLRLRNESYLQDSIGVKFKCKSIKEIIIGFNSK